MKLGDTLQIQDKFQEVENGLIYNSHQLKAIDTELTSQMTNLQEQMTQVQLELEAKLEEMNEALVNKGADVEMLTDLNRVFQNLQIDIERTQAMQDRINDNHKKLISDIDRLKFEIELLRDLKSDRDEALDALRDKADIKEINKMVTNECFVANLGKLEQDINNSHLIFRKQELSWQKAIDDLSKQIDGKVDFRHIQGLRDDTTKHLNKLKQQIDCVKSIIGEPLAASVIRRIYRDTSCLSCANPAHIMPQEDTVPILPPLRSAGAAQLNDPSKEENALTACKIGLKITHAMDPRAKMCTRYCGGSHTKKRPVTRNANKLRLQGKSLRTPDIVATVGYDGKIYQVADEDGEQPCIPCNEEFGAGEGSYAELPNEERKSLRRETLENCYCGDEKEVSS
ncbi:hypothetical protein O0L34_g16394 [Tuta absoluta]|nr:hypothetical protein O0L34_g16394 [Tuta absoluta]